MPTLNGSYGGSNTSASTCRVQNFNTPQMYLVPHRRDDRDVQHEHRPTPSPVPLADPLGGRREGQRAMRPVAVVMLHEDVKDPLKMLVVPAASEERDSP